MGLGQVERVPNKPDQAGRWPLVIRGGPEVELNYHLLLSSTIGEPVKAMIRVALEPAPTGAGYRAENLWPGTTAWADRPMRLSELPAGLSVMAESVGINLHRTGDYSLAFDDFEAYDGDGDLVPQDHLRVPGVYIVYVDTLTEWGWQMNVNDDVITVTDAAPAPSVLQRVSRALR